MGVSISPSPIQAANVQPLSVVPEDESQAEPRSYINQVETNDKEAAITIMNQPTMS